MVGPRRIGHDASQSREERAADLACPDEAWLDDAREPARIAGQEVGVEVNKDAPRGGDLRSEDPIYRSIRPPCDDRLAA